MSYFRSGGTLLNRCLGAMPNVVVMSEVGPHKVSKSADVVTVKQQAEAWYGIQLKSNDFLGSVRELHDICEATGRYLVLRLWVVGEFAKGRKHSPLPTYRLSAYHTLCREYQDPPAMALVRDAIDIWISRDCQPEGFFRNYRRYVEALVNDGVPVEKYESLCERPDATMKRICECLRLPYSPQYKYFHEFRTARGDLDVATSRARNENSIKVLRRRRVDRNSRKFINSSEDMAVCNSLLGYPTRYENGKVESLYDTLAAKCSAVVGKHSTGR